MSQWQDANNDLHQRSSVRNSSERASSRRLLNLPLPLFGRGLSLLVGELSANWSFITEDPTGLGSIVIEDGMGSEREGSRLLNLLVLDKTASTPIFRSPPRVASLLSNDRGFSLAFSTADCSLVIIMLNSWFSVSISLRRHVNSSAEHSIENTLRSNR